MKKFNLFLFGLLFLFFLSVLLLIVPNSIGEKIREEARAQGYLEYTPLQAKKLAELRCSQCHHLDRIAKYCRRCGPPFVVVITHMKRLMKQYKETNPQKEIMGLTKPQEAAVVQVWNAMVGNWEKDFRREDMVSMIGKNNDHLLALLDTPIEKRKIEHSLMKTGDRLKGVYEEKGIGKGMSKENP